MATRANRGRLRLVESVLEAGTPPGEAASTPVPGLPAGEGRSRSTLPPEVPAVAAAPRPTQRPAPLGSPLRDLPDAQLVALGCKGDNQALELLYRRHATFAIHLAARIEGSAHDVEDIAHDAFLRAFERLNDLTDRGAFRSWLGAIVVHAVRSRMRRQRLLSLLGMGKSAEPVDLDAIASSDASPDTRAQIAQIYALLRTLPTDDRIAWTLRAVEGHELEVVARLTGCSLATVKRRISRAQRFLEDTFVTGDRLAEGPSGDGDADVEETSSR